MMDYMDEDPLGLPPSNDDREVMTVPKAWDVLRQEIKKTRRLAQNLTCRYVVNFISCLSLSDGNMIV